MALFTVVEVIDGDTFKVRGGWRWRGQTGDLVRPTGYDTPEKGEEGYHEARRKLEALILGKTVEIEDVKKIDRGRLVADVYFKGRPLADYFPEYCI
jgi:micrococcal nuclease